MIEIFFTPKFCLHWPLVLVKLHWRLCNTLGNERGTLLYFGYALWEGI